MFRELEAALCEITGFAAVSLQPNSGAQGEFAGLMVIRAYHRDRGDSQPRRRADSVVGARHQSGERGHGRHEGRGRGLRRAGQRRRRGSARAKARAAPRRAGGADGDVSVDARRVRGEIQEVCAIVHEHGGQVYMDGANMNAQVGLTSPAAIGADVCHLNLHKTFAIPHGGGGPGMGPIARGARTWRRTCPGHPVVQVGGEQAIHAVSAAPWGSASILLISYGYIRMLGGDGHDRRHAVRDPERQLHQGAARAALPCSTRSTTAAWRTR